MLVRLGKLHFAGLDAAERAVLEAALGQHGSSSDPDSASGHVAASAWQPHPGTGLPDNQAVPTGPAVVPVAATAADGFDDVTEALCCPITHVRIWLVPMRQRITCLCC